MDLVTALVVIIVILLIYRLTSGKSLPVFTDNPGEGGIYLALAGGFIAWKVLCHLRGGASVSGADEDNVIAPSDLSLDAY